MTQPRRPSSLVVGNVRVAGRRTSMRLEPEYWEALADIARIEEKPVDEVCTQIAAGRAGGSLTSAVRAFVLRYYMQAATPEGHRLAGHGRRVQP